MTKTTTSRRISSHLFNSIQVFSMEGKIFTLTLLCLVFTGSAAITVDILQSTYEAVRGKNVTMSCKFTTTSTKAPALMDWSVQAEQVGADEIEIISYYADGTIDIAPQYKGRAFLDMNIPTGKFDMTLTSVTLDDNKIFKCRVQIPGDQGKSSDTAYLVVLVAPSTPDCGIQGTAEYGQNISLTCASREGSPLPTYNWNSYDVQNKPRVLDPKNTGIKDSTLFLYNIANDTSGFFICTSSNKVGSAKCNITLAVMPPSMKIGSTAGIIAGVAIALLLFIILVYCCCCRKKKNKEEEYAMGVPEEEPHEKMLAKNAESPHADGQEEIRTSENTYVKSPADGSDHYEERSERAYDKRKDYDDRRSDYDDRRSDFDDRRSDYKDRRSDYDDRRSDYDDRRSDYSDRRDKYSDRHERHDDNRRYDDERRYKDRRDRHYDDDRYDEPYDDRNRDQPPVPSNKPPRRNYD